MYNNGKEKKIEQIQMISNKCTDSLEKKKLGEINTKKFVNVGFAYS